MICSSTALTEEFVVGTVVEVIFIVDAKDRSTRCEQVVAIASSELQLATQAVTHALEGIASVAVTRPLGLCQLMRPTHLTKATAIAIPLAKVVALDVINTWLLRNSD